MTIIHRGLAPTGPATATEDAAPLLQPRPQDAVPATAPIDVVEELDWRTTFRGLVDITSLLGMDFEALRISNPAEYAELGQMMVQSPFDVGRLQSVDDVRAAVAEFRSITMRWSIEYATQFELDLCITPGDIERSWLTLCAMRHMTIGAGHPILDELAALRRTDAARFETLMRRADAHHILCVQRFATVALLEQTLDDLEPAATDTRPVALLPTARSDYNGALEWMRFRVEALRQGFRPVYVEGSTEAELVANARTETRTRRAAFAQLTGHGNPFAVTVGTAPGNAALIDDGDTPELAGFSDCLEPDAVIVMASCSTGARRHGIAHRVATATGHRTIAPRRDTHLPEYSLGHPMNAMQAPLGRAAPGWRVVFDVPVRTFTPHRHVTRRSRVR